MTDSQQGPKGPEHDQPGEVEVFNRYRNVETFRKICDRKPDIEKIKKLDAKEVGLKLGIIHKIDDRYGFIDERHTGGIMFDDEGRFYNHKISGSHGSCIDLVMQFDAGIEGNKHRENVVPDQRRYFWSAATRIAVEFDLWESFDHVLEYAQRLTIDFDDLDPEVEADRKTYMARLQWGIQWIAGTKGKPNPVTPDVESQLRETIRLFQALGLDARKVTLCPYNGSIGFIPNLPYFEPPDEALTTEEGLYRIANWGWRKEVFEETINRGENAGDRVIFIDIDGKEGVKPSIAMIDRLTSTLIKKGLSPTAVVLSTMAGAWHSKFHYFFKELNYPQGYSEYARHATKTMEFLADTINEIVGSWGLEAKIAETMRPDTACLKPWRIARIPGFGKLGSDVAAVVHATPEEGQDGIDFRTAMERRKFTFHVGETSYHFGSLCYKEVPGKKDDDPPKKTPFAQHIYPVMQVQDSQGENRSVLVTFKKNGVDHWTYGTVPLAAAQDPNQARKVAGELAGKGAMVESDSGRNLMEAIVSWANNYESELITGFSRPGWVKIDGRFCYPPYGENRKFCIGDDFKVFDNISEDPEHVEEWREEIASLMTSPVVKLTVGASFAAGLLSLLNAMGANFDAFLFNIYGPSSSGKSLSTKLAQSVWGDPDNCESWNATDNALEYVAGSSHGRLLVLDELKLAKPPHVASFIQRLATGGSRKRLKRDGASMQKGKSWELVALSSGENSLAEFCGDMYQGGQLVRGIDIEVEHNTIFTSAAHAQEAEKFCMPANSRFHGVVGRRWVEALKEVVNATEGSQDLVQAAHDYIAQRRTDWEGLANETGRILDNLILVEFAALVAKQADCWPTGVEIDFVDWALKQIMDRGEIKGTSPEERFYHALLRKWEVEPGLFPPSNIQAEDRSRIHGEILGYYNSQAEKGNLDEERPCLYLNETMLESSSLASEVGVSSRLFLRWVVDQGLADRPSSGLRIAGSRKRYTALWLDLDE